MDLDYKGLANCGTWLIGRLQTERDRERVAEGLLGTGAAAGLDRATVASLLANLSQRTFLMRNVHEDAPVLCRSRWALSYLRGPMTLQEIPRLRQGAAAGDSSSASGGGARSPQREVPAVPFAANRPVIQAGIRERFVNRPGAAATPTYRGHCGARVRAHFVDARSGMDAWETWYCLARLGEDGPDWPSAETASESGLAFAGLADRLQARAAPL